MKNIRRIPAFVPQDGRASAGRRLRKFSQRLVPSSPTRSTEIHYVAESKLGFDAKKIRHQKEEPRRIDCFREGQMSMLEVVAGSEAEDSMSCGGDSTVTERHAVANNPYIGTGEQVNAS